MIPIKQLDEQCRLRNMSIKRERSKYFPKYILTVTNKDEYYVGKVSNCLKCGCKLTYPINYSNVYCWNCLLYIARQKKCKKETIDMILEHL